MLSGHPHIEKAYIRELFKDCGNLHQTLIVETNLKDPASGDKKHNKEWSALQNYLLGLASNDFADFSSVELKGYT